MTNYIADEEEAKQMPKDMVRVAGVMHNRLAHQFVFDSNFFDLIGLGDSEED